MSGFKPGSTLAHPVLSAPEPPPVQASAHTLYKTSDTDKPATICDRNGEVCLALCRVCGLGESQLDKSPVCRGVPASAPEPSNLTTCNCRWKGDELVQQCTLHEAWKDAIHDWAERAKKAEAALSSVSPVPAAAPAVEPDMRAICEALGFDPTNHHNAAKCPYCRPSPEPAAAPAVEPTDEQLNGWIAQAQTKCFGVLKQHRYVLDVYRATLPASPEPSELHTLMELNAWRSALLGLCQGASDTHDTPEKAAANVRRRLGSMGRASPAPEPATQGAAKPVHTDHPFQHWDRTCPACVLEASPPAPEPLTPAVGEPDERVLNLLARIHRDGGHYVAEHGLHKALQDAEGIVIERIAALDEIAALKTATHGLSEADSAKEASDEWFREDSLELVGWKYHGKGDGEGTFRLITPNDTYNPDQVTPGSMVPVYARLSGSPVQPAVRGDAEALRDARLLIKECLDALATELTAWDLDPPLAHVKKAHDRCIEWLAQTPEGKDEP